MTINSDTEKYETFQVYSYYNSILNDLNEPRSSIAEEIISKVISKQTPDYHNIAENCKKLNDYITRSTSSKCIDNICFEITNFWLNNQVRSDFKETDNSSLDNYMKFMQGYDKLNSYASKIYYIHEKLFKKKKVLYKLYNDYDKLLDIFENYDSSKCVLLSTIVDDYNKIIVQYPYKDNSNFSEVLTHFRSTFEVNANEYIKKCSPKIMEFNSFVDPPISRTHSADYSNQSSGDVDRFPSQPSENIASTLAITLFGTSLGSFLILMFFYKITLFGYKLRNKKNKNILMTNNLCEETYELPVYTSEEHDRNSQYRNYNVTYQSLEN
ncbi:PIR Superfamily Protein [Plasmodium ovale wallikeri]|uniref:PIR protein n=2 Tax=Plasmodium ovale TaxID=36330 RepID=A0A1C3KGW9_PLAOA|nr:PIR Superfamily Protein [Plasmodium ovale wallikeri]SBT72957.1 PIR protein [Plasmodium ovale]